MCGGCQLSPGARDLQTANIRFISVINHINILIFTSLSIIDILTFIDTCLQFSKLIFFEKGVDILSVDNPGNVMYSRIHPATIDVTP